MKLFISHSSALYLIRQDRRYGHMRKDPQRVTFSPDLGKPRDVTMLLESPGLCRLPRPVHLLVDRNQRRCHMTDQVRHSTVHVPSSRSFVRLERDVYYACPELCFVQLAEHLDLIELIELGYELCGCYTQTQDESVETEYNLEPVTSLRRLQWFTESNSHLKGSRKARRALRYIRANSYSPMESILVMLLCLPVMLGGYGIPWPQLNVCIDFTDQYGRKAKRYCDLYWSDMRLAIEYDSDEFHAPGTKWQHDSMRRVELGLQDIEVVSVGPMQIINETETEKLARLIARRSRRQIPPRNFAYSEVRQILRQTLMP